MPSLINKKKKKNNRKVKGNKLSWCQSQRFPPGGKMESLRMVLAIQLRHHYASTHLPLFWESQLPLVGLSQSKFCRHPTAFRPSDSPSSSTERPLTWKMNASRNSKEQSARFLLVFFFYFLQLGFRATVDRLKTFITILVKHIYASANRTS